MKQDASKLSRIAFVAAVTVAISFGATEALAKPAEPTRAGPYCDPVACDAYCRSVGGESGACYAVGCLCVH